MKILLKTLKKESFELDVCDSMTILEIKELIELSFGFDHSKLKLIFNSVILDNDKTLNEYQIAENYTIVMLNLKLIKKGEEASNSNVADENKQINVESTDDLEIYSNEANNTGGEGINSQTQSNPLLEHIKEQLNEEKVIEADIRADNAVQYVASIMKILCIQEPEKGKEFFKNFEEDNPQIMRLIKKNDTEFKRLLYSPKTDQDVEIFKKFYSGQIKEVDPDSDNIQKLMDYGFPHKKAKEAYEACDKQFELALNLLLDGNI